MLMVLRLLANLAGPPVQRATRRLARASGLFVLALLFLMIGLTGFAVAAFLLLTRAVDPIVAALLVGALCCLIGAVLFLVAREQANPKQLFVTPPGQRPIPTDISVKLESPTPAAGAMSLALAALVGFLVATRKK